MRATPPRPTDLRVGDYRLLAKIGEGGMGVVHLAQRPHGARVALKVLRPHVVGDDEARARLAREVASLRRVRSPRVAEILDADPWGETPFVATRYVPGLSLHQHVASEGPLAGRDLLHFATGLAEAVVAVHTVGVLHRDVKPSNVLLEGRSPVLIDFGLARLADDPRLTHTGWLLGTPGYLAPEILYGEDATTAADVHSWAATLVFAATGRPPFGTGPALAIMDRVRRGEHDLTGVPEPLLRLVRDCLAPDPRARPETAAILASLRALAGASGPAGGPTVDQPTMPFALAAAPPDDDPTEVLGSTGRTEVVAPTALVPPVSPVSPVPPVPRRPVAAPAERRPTALRAGGLTAALAVLVACGFSAAPYLTFGLVALLALVVRTLSWTGDAVGQRRRLRGPRWYDGPAAVLTAPWYLLVATAGTVLLVGTAAGLTVVLAGVALLFRGPVLPVMLLLGAVLSQALWWGPGGRRVRVPVRRAARVAARRPWAGWTVLAVLLVAAAGALYVGGTAGASWAPAAGAPWRDGTLLGGLLHHL